VYADPRVSRDTGAVTTRPSVDTRDLLESTVPSGARTWIALDVAVTDVLNRSWTSVGGTRTVDCVSG
jgi:hypothetical protein